MSAPRIKSLNPTPSQPTLTELKSDFRKGGDRHIRFSDKKQLHIKQGFRVSGLLAKLGNSAALQERKTQRENAVSHIKSGIDAEYGKGMGERVFAKFTKDIDDVSRGVGSVISITCRKSPTT